MNPTYSFVAARSLLWLYNRNFASTSVWEFSPFLGWRMITSQLSPDISFTAASGSIYIASDQTTLNTLAVAQRCAIEPSKSQFGILRINPEVEAGSCEVVVASNNTLYVEDGSSIQLVWSECISIPPPDGTGFNCTCHVWPSTDSVQGRWSISLFNSVSGPHVLVYQDTLLVTGNSYVQMASASDPILTATSYNQSYHMYVIEDQIWAFNFGLGFHITYGPFNPITPDDGHGFDVVGCPIPASSG